MNDIHPYWEGFRSYHAGVDNPYLSADNAEAWLKWCEGWEQAEYDDMRGMLTDDNLAVVG